MALASNSVLLKYNSEHVLFYFGGLQPWLHYVPVEADQDVLAVLQLESEFPDLFKSIARNGKQFARSFLGKESLIKYTAYLLQFYKSLALPAGVSKPQSPARQPQAAGISLTSILAHVANVGDQETRQGQWLGTPGSKNAIEGFAIFLGPGVAKEGFSYRSLTKEGILTDRKGSEEYVGTRSKALPIHGVRIEAEPPFSENYNLLDEATFVDGSKSGPLASGALCKSDSNAPMEALRLSLWPRQDPDN